LKKLENELTWKDLEIGCIVTEPGSTREYRTGDWRSEGCIGQNAEGYFQSNLFWCKGCGICSKECPTKVISMVNEEA